MLNYNIVRVFVYFFFITIFCNLSDCFCANCDSRREVYADCFLGSPFYSSEHTVSYFYGSNRIDSEVFSLNSGLNLDVGFGYMHGESYAFVLDFGYFKSISEQENDFSVATDHSTFKNSLYYWLLGASIDLPALYFLVPYINASFGIGNIEQKSHFYSDDQYLSGFYNIPKRTSFVASAKIGAYVNFSLPILLEYKIIFLPNNLSERSNVEKGDIDSFVSNHAIKSGSMTAHSVAFGIRLYL